MKEQRFLKVVRLLTFTTILGIFSLTASAKMVNDESCTAGHGGVDSYTMETIALEDWMTQTPFKVRPTSFANAIEMEPWMTDRDEFKTLEELELDELESWMLDKEHFEIREQRNLNAIEDWMVDQNFWKI